MCLLINKKLLFHDVTQVPCIFVPVGQIWMMEVHDKQSEVTLSVIDHSILETVVHHNELILLQNLLTVSHHQLGLPRHCDRQNGPQLLIGVAHVWQLPCAGFQHYKL